MTNFISWPNNKLNGCKEVRNMVFLANLTKSGKNQMENLYSNQNYDLSINCNDLQDEKFIADSQKIDESRIEFIELTKSADKQKWMKRFFNGYSGTVNKAVNFYGSDSTFIVAKINNKEMGFVRINNYSDAFEGFASTKVMNVTDAYVKPCYRNKNVLKYLIKYVITNYNAKMLLIETDRYRKNFQYYYSLGFTRYFDIKDSTLSRAFLGEFWPVVVESRKNLWCKTQ